jgi:hypothetical protein
VKNIKLNLSKFSAVAILLVAAIITCGGIAAAQSSSSSYKVNEYSFGIGGELNACSSNYCSKQSAGETAVGNTSSSSYQAQAGFDTVSDPVLEVAVNGSINFGVLDVASTASGTANVQVRTYLASGYTMIIAGPAPVNGSSNLDPMSTPTTSQIGTEQFGINLRNNATPDVGADPVQIPDSSFSFGTPSSDYNVPDQYKYQNGDTIAYSNSSSGQTNYTLSMIVNMAASTPGGIYTSDYSIVVISVF